MNKVTYQYQPTITFESLSIGDCFLYNNSYYMKIQLDALGHVNAVTLIDGFTSFITNNSICVPITKITIEKHI